MDELLFLFQKALDKDEEAWDRLYRNLRPFGLRVISEFCLTTEDAEDMLQTAFEKFYKSIRQFNGYTQAQLIAYFKQICKNTCRDFIGKQKETIELEENTVSSTSNVDDEITVKELMERLSLQEQQILLLKVKGYSEKEISKILKKPQGTVASRWYRIIEKVKNKI